mgnify:CR=1 FL=1
MRRRGQSKAVVVLGKGGHARQPLLKATNAREGPAAAALVGILAAIAVIYNLRQASGRANLDRGKESTR